MPNPHVVDDDGRLKRPIVGKALILRCALSHVRDSFTRVNPLDEKLVGQPASNNHCWPKGHLY
jgi:hypothetical protein